MADPKYANLPGIAYDQPDVYETSDLPEVDQASLDIGDESESVERVNIVGSEAYNKFKGKKLDSSKTDFSDRISHTRRIGYDVLHGEFEMAEDGSKDETVLQKYQRLQHELRTLVEDVNKIQETVKGSEKNEDQSPVPSMKQVKELEKQLLEIRLEEMLASEVLANISDPLGSLQKNLLTHVEKMKTSSTANEDSKEKSTKQADEKLIYELHFKPEHAKFHQSAKIAEFEQRLRKLEDVVGHEPDKLHTLAIDTNQKGLLAAVMVLNSKMNLLDTDQLDQVEMRLHLLSQKLTQIAEKKNVIDNADKESKISEAYDLLKKIDNLKNTLPNVVERMMALQQLHEQALQFSKAVTQLDVTQQQIQTRFQDNQKLLKEVQTNFSKNMDVINKNITSLNARFSALKK